MSSAPPVITSLNIQSFRHLQGLKLVMAPVTLVVGGAAVGKSTVLEAVGLVLRPTDAGQWSSMLRRRDMDVSIVEGIWTIFPDYFVQENLSKPIAVSATLEPSRTRGRTQTHMLACAGLGDTLYVDVRNTIHFADEAATQVAEKRLWFPGNDTQERIQPACSTFSLGMGTYGKMFVEGFRSAIDRGYKEMVLRLLQAFDETIENISIVAAYDKETIALHIAGKEGRPAHRVGLPTVGDGLRRVLALGLSLARAARGVLIVDELESGLSIDVMQGVIKTFFQIADQLQVQVVASTNSLELIDMVLVTLEDVPAQDNDLIIHHLWIEHTDEPPKARSYELDKAIRLRDRGLDLR